MNRFSKDIEFLVHWAVVLKTSVHKSWSIYKWNFLNGDPSMSFFMWHAGQIPLNLSSPLTPWPVLILTWCGRAGDTDRHWTLVSFVMVELRFHYLIVANINLIKAITESFKKKSVVLVVFPAIQLTPVCTHLKKNVFFFFFCSVCLVSDHLNSVEVGLSASQRIYEKCNFSWISKELGTQSRNFLAQVTKKRPVIFQHKCKQKDKNYFYSQPNLVAER